MGISAPSSPRPRWSSTCSVISSWPSVEASVPPASSDSTRPESSPPKLLPPPTSREMPLSWLSSLSPRNIASRLSWIWKERSSPSILGLPVAFANRRNSSKLFLDASLLPPSPRLPNLRVQSRLPLHHEDYHHLQALQKVS